MLDLLQGIRVVSFNHFLLGPMGIQGVAATLEQRGYLAQRTRHAACVH